MPCNQDNMTHSMSHGLDQTADSPLEACIDQNCRSIFFARCPPRTSAEELQSLFGRYGTVTSLNLFRRWATAKTSKGCGVVTFTGNESAAAALEALHGHYMWPDSEAPMIVEWIDPDRQAATKLRRFLAAPDATPPDSKQVKKQGNSSSGGSSPEHGKLAGKPQAKTPAAAATQRAFGGGGSSSGRAAAHLLAPWTNICDALQRCPAPLCALTQPRSMPMAVSRQVVSASPCSGGSSGQQLRSSLEAAVAASHDRLRPLPALRSPSSSLLSLAASTPSPVPGRNMQWLAALAQGGSDSSAAPSSAASHSSSWGLCRSSSNSGSNSIWQSWQAGSCNLSTNSGSLIGNHDQHSMSFNSCPCSCCSATGVPAAASYLDGASGSRGARMPVLGVCALAQQSLAATITSSASRQVCNAANTAANFGHSPQPSYIDQLRDLHHQQQQMQVQRQAWCGGPTFAAAAAAAADGSITCGGASSSSAFGIINEVPATDWRVLQQQFDQHTDQLAAAAMDPGLTAAGDASLAPAVDPRLTAALAAAIGAAARTPAAPDSLLNSPTSYMQPLPDEPEYIPVMMPPLTMSCYSTARGAAAASVQAASAARATTPGSTAGDVLLNLRPESFALIAGSLDVVEKLSGAVLRFVERGQLPLVLRVLGRQDEIDLACKLLGSLGAI